MQTDQDITKTSSVMEYIPEFSVYPFTVLGKYDLAVLKFLYTDQITREGQTIPLKTPRNPEQQIKLSELDVLKDKNPKYESCPDWMVIIKFLCIPHDYGSTPKEIVNFYRHTIKRTFNRTKYLYDVNQTFQSVGQGRFAGFVQFINEKIFAINLLYSHWMGLKNERFKEQREKALYAIYPEDQHQAQQKVIQTYMDTISPYENEETQQLKEGITQEYVDYYEMRPAVTQFVEDFIFMETMKCEVRDKDGKTYLIAIETIQAYLPNSMTEVWYVEDCFSEDIKNSLASHDLQVVAQHGMENFSQFHSPHHVNYKPNEKNALPIIFFESQDFHDLLRNVTGELDFLHNVRLKLQAFFLEDTVSILEFNRGQEYFFNVNRQVIAQQNVAPDTEIKIYTIQYFKIHKYDNSSSSDPVFYQQMANFINKKLYESGKSDQQFLIAQYTSTEYEEYKRQNSGYTDEVSLFQQYLFGLDSVFVSQDQTKVIIPYQEDNLASIQFVKYYTNLRRIKELNEKATQEELTFLEHVERIYKRTQNEFIENQWL